MSTLKFRCPSRWTLRQRPEHYSIVGLPAAAASCAVGDTGRPARHVQLASPGVARPSAGLDRGSRRPPVRDERPAPLRRARLHQPCAAVPGHDCRQHARPAGERVDTRAPRQRRTGRIGNAPDRRAKSPRPTACPRGWCRTIKHDQLAAALKLPRPPIRISKSDKLLATMEQHQSILQEVLQAMAEESGLKDGLSEEPKGAFALYRLAKFAHPSLGVRPSSPSPRAGSGRRSWPAPASSPRRSRRRCRRARR